MRTQIALFVVLTLAAWASRVGAQEPINVGSRLELFADSHLIDRLAGEARQQLHRPTPREVAVVMDQPWEGNAVNYVTAFQDGELYRLYYRGADVQYDKDGYRETHREVCCYAESKDGVQWTKPKLGLFDFNGSKDNNIVWDGLGQHNFTPFKDANPAAAADAKYKAIGYGENESGRGLFAFKSADAIHWSLMSDKPVITKGAFDSQNLAFWDAVRGQYREYHRDFRDGRDIRTCTSQDFLTWTEPVFLEYTPGRVSELYTNGIAPYYRAPHIFLGFPTRYIDRGWTEAVKALPRYDYRLIRGAKSPREGTAVTDGMFMASRDGLRFQVWPESFIRPGLRTTDSWFYGDNYQNWGLVETKSAIADAPRELSMYVTENTMQERTAYLRRHTLRIDGFVSVIRPAGRRRNRHPAAALRRQPPDVELFHVRRRQHPHRSPGAAGTPVPGFTLADAPEIYGDSLSQAVPWKEGSKLVSLAAQPVRLRFVLTDADLFSFQFLPGDE